MYVLHVLIRTPAFWASGWALVNVIVIYFVPSMPKEIIGAANAFAAVIFGAIVGQSTPAKVENVRAMRAMQEDALADKFPYK